MSFTLALRAWRSPRRRENETTQHRNARDPERRWGARATSTSSTGGSEGLGQRGQAAIAPNAEHTVRLEYSYADPNTGNGPGNTERRACPQRPFPKNRTFWPLTLAVL
jgi:hypothetical protein